MPYSERVGFEWIEPGDDATYAERFGYRFRAALEERKLSQHAAAAILKRPQGRLSEYANGKRMPPLDTLNEMIFALDLDPRILFPELFARVRLLESIERMRPRGRPRSDPRR